MVKFDNFRGNDNKNLIDILKKLVDKLFYRIWSVKRYCIIIVYVSAKILFLKVDVRWWQKRSPVFVLCP